MNEVKKVVSKAQKLKKMIEGPEIMILPGCHDCISAIIAEDEGFETVFFHDNGLAVASYGIPDVGLITLTDMVDMLRRITKSVKIPVMADGANGFGGSLNTYHTVREYIGAGATSITIDDQDFPKRCGHHEGKRLVSIGAMVAKLEAAKDASKGQDFLIVARTDAFGVYDADEAIKRGNIFAKQGASLIFVDAIPNVDDVKKVIKGIKAPVLINQPIGLKTPQFTAKELQDMGAAVVQYGSPSLLAGIRAARVYFKILKEKGTVKYDLEMFESSPAMNKKVNVDFFIELDDKYLEIQRNIDKQLQNT